MQENLEQSKTDSDLAEASKSTLINHENPHMLAPPIKEVSSLAATPPKTAIACVNISPGDDASVSLKQVVSCDHASVPRTTSLATLLVLEISSQSLDKESFITYAPTIKFATTRATCRLYVHIINPLLACPPEQRAKHWTKVQKLSTFVYSTCTFINPSSDITILFDGWSVTRRLFQENWEAIFTNSEAEARRIFGDMPAIRIISDKNNSDDNLVDANVQYRASSCVSQPYNDSAIPIVTVNGTFDHLHHGHKNQLTLAAWLASTTLLCSISPDDPSLLERKKYSSVMQNYSIRAAAVQAFLQKIKPSVLTIKCVPKLCNLGAQVSEENVQATVLSTESVYLAPKIMAARIEADLPKIDVFAADVVTGRGLREISGNLIAEKLSSSDIRQTLLQRRLTFVLINGHAGVGKHSIAMALGSLIPQSRIIDNHLLVDLADALCSRDSPNYTLLRGELQRVVMNHIITDRDATGHTSGNMTYIFTSNFTKYFLGTEVAIYFQETAARSGARLIPINLICSREEIMRRVASPERHHYSRGKLTNPTVAATILDKKIMFEFDVEDKLSINVSSLSASNAAAQIFRHIKALN